MNSKFDRRKRKERRNTTIGIYFVNETLSNKNRIMMILLLDLFCFW